MEVLNCIWSKKALLFFWIYILVLGSSDTKKTCFNAFLVNLMKSEKYYFGVLRPKISFLHYWRTIFLYSNIKFSSCRRIRILVREDVVPDETLFHSPARGMPFHCRSFFSGGNASWYRMILFSECKWCFI